MKCFACGTEKDLAVESTYPYNGEHDSLTQEIPIPQLLTIECQAEKHLPNGSWGFRMAIMCHECWHRLGENTKGIDMWIGQRCWETLSPVVPFCRLPEPKNFLAKGEEGPDDRKWDARSYEKYCPICQMDPCICGIISDEKVSSEAIRDQIMVGLAIPEKGFSGK